ncbi:MAG: hypothetical protein IPI51_07340 [Betaproteobacteria bacterium]|nr:hypothetical protein [Betaproteobacteria bacterium]
MMAHAKKQLPNAVALLLGFSIAIVFAPIVLATADWYRQWSAEHNPPATLQWNSVERIDTDTLRLTMLVTRHRDCQMVRVLGYTGKSLQAMQSAESLEREDGRPPQSYPVGITVISRPWLLRGIYGGKVAVSAYYDCDEAVIKAPLLVGDVPEIER